MTTGRINQVASIPKPAHSTSLETANGKQNKHRGNRRSSQPNVQGTQLGVQPTFAASKITTSTWDTASRTNARYGTHALPSHPPSAPPKRPGRNREKKPHKYRTSRRHRNRDTAPGHQRHKVRMSRTACIPFIAQARSQEAKPSQTQLTCLHVRKTRHQQTNRTPHCRRQASKQHHKKAPHPHRLAR
jgi:hypothetical protein